MNSFFNREVESHKKSYEALCISAHANIKGVNLDYPKYLENRIEDSLKLILNLVYGNIQMMAECFADYLDVETKIVVKESMESIAKVLRSIPLFEPTKQVYQSKIILKNGNFLDAFQS